MSPVKDWSKYPSNWKTVIRPAILERAKNCCEQCAVPNYTEGWITKDGRFISCDRVFRDFENSGYDWMDEGEPLAHKKHKDGQAYKPTKIVLTIAHLDGTTTNNDYSNLKALCQFHHLSHDQKETLEKARNTRNNKKGLQNLF